MRDRFGTYRLLTGHEGPGRCFWCGAGVDGRRRYCCGEHTDLYWRHFIWSWAARWCLDRHGHTCVDCGETAVLAHHVVPLAGSSRVANILNRPENVVALCNSCHGKRHTGPKADVLEAARERGQFVFEGLLHD